MNRSCGHSSNSATFFVFEQSGRSGQENFWHAKREGLTLKVLEGIRRTLLNSWSDCVA